MKSKLFAAFLLGCSLQVAAQDLVGTPLNVPYATLLDWLLKPEPGRQLMADWIREELHRHAAPSHRSFVKSVEIRLQGHAPGSGCDSLRSFAHARITAQGKPEIVFCIRTIQYLEQLARAFELGIMNEMVADAHKRRREQLLDNYFAYIATQMNSDRDLPEDPRHFKQFCTIEFYILVNALGFFGNQCPDGAVNKHNADFARFFWGGGFFPDWLHKLPTDLTRQEVVNNYVQNNKTTGWRSLWRAAALHELGHLVSCHQGRLPGLRCTGSPTLGAGNTSIFSDKHEAEADAYALERIIATNIDQPDLAMATVNSLIIHNLSRAFWSQGEEFRTERLASNQNRFKASMRKLVNHDELAKILDGKNPEMQKMILEVFR
ncbi:MAG: hypothetical protein ACO1PN_06795 [Betaproteobacteria bacterium]